MSLIRDQMAFESDVLTIAQSDRYVDDCDVLISESDCLDFLRTVPGASMQLIVSSPPYNLGKTYERRQKLEDYLAWQKDVLSECARVLKPEGSLCWQVGNHVSSGEIYPLDILFYRILKDDLDLRLRNRIIWHFGHGLHASKRFSGRYEVVLWFTKSDAYLFNLDPVRVPQLYPGKRHHKGDKKGQFSGNPMGKNPGDLWEMLESEWDSAVWDIPNVKWNHPEKTVHPAQFPIELVERLVLALSNPGDCVLDPFMGVGSSVIAAVLHERRAVGVDSKAEYVQLAIERIAKLSTGTLRRRPFGTLKYQPNQKDKIAQRPREWDKQS